MPTPNPASETTPSLAELALALAQSLPGLGRRHLPILLAIGVTALLSGCGSVGTSAGDEYYKPPALARSELATLQGSLTKSQQAFDETSMACVVLIDSMFLSDPKESCSQPIALAPGLHIVTAEYTHGRYSSRTNLRLEAKAGAAYQVMIREWSDDPDAPRYCDFWIVDQATFQPVTPISQTRAPAKVIRSMFYD